MLGINRLQKKTNVIIFDDVIDFLRKVKKWLKDEKEKFTWYELINLLFSPRERKQNKWKQPADPGYLNIDRGLCYSHN